MTLPTQVPNVAEWQMCRVRWTIRDYSGAPQAVESVRFLSAVPYVIAAGSRATMAALFPDARFVAGKLTNAAGDPWVDVVASEDPDINPRNWTITVAALLVGGQSISATFTTPINGDIDLSTVVPVPVSSGNAIVQGNGVLAITSNGATATVTYTNGTTGTFVLPVGTQSASLDGGSAATTGTEVTDGGTAAA